MEANETIKDLTTKPLYPSDAEQGQFTARHREWLASIMAEPYEPAALDRGRASRSDATMPGHVRSRHNLRRGGFRY